MSEVRGLMTIDGDFVSEFDSWNIPLNMVQSLRMDDLARPVFVSYIANEDARTNGQLCHCDEEAPIHADGSVIYS